MTNWKIRERVRAPRSDINELFNEKSQRKKNKYQLQQPDKTMALEANQKKKKSVTF